MKTTTFLICATVSTMAVSLVGAQVAFGQKEEQPVVQPAAHDQPIKQPLPDYIRDTADDHMAAVTEDALFLGSAGIGEYWQYRDGDDTCVGFFFYEKEDIPVFNATCGDPNDPTDPGIYGMDTIVFNDKTVMQSAWFPGSWEDNQDYTHAVVSYKEIDALPYAADGTPLSAHFERPVAVDLPDQQGPIELPMVSGDSVALKTANRVAHD